MHRLLASCGIALTLLSCGLGKRPYEFVAKNNTNLRIDKLEIGGTGKNPATLSLSPMGTSETFTRKYVKNCFLCFDAPGTSIGVTEFTDSTGTHSHEAGIWVQIKTLSTRRTNTINITLDPAPGTPTRVFRVSVD